MNLAYLIPLFPLLGFLINGLFRKSLSKTIIAFIGCLTVLLSFIVSFILFIQLPANGILPANALFTILQTSGFTIHFAFQVDALSVLFILIITGVGFLIHLYSVSYMETEAPEHYARYFSYLNLFVFFMLLLVLGNNYFVMFIGWEGVGLCSYLLIGFWFQNNSYNAAAKKAFIMNRIGDLGFLLALFWLLSKLGTLQFDEVFAQAPARFSISDITGITLLLFIGATGKSAQIPLYTWLPDAMAGPTPVSALIHAATMVTAGIYMVVRSHVLYNLAPVTQNVVAIIGLLTALLGATIALKQNDIKKVLAYSTVSQLGYMFLALGSGAYIAGVFHVMTHAFFKALLFLGAGSVIHAMGGEQDIRKMGGLRKALPITHICFLLACFAIAGVPPFSGFFSKDEILAAAFYKNEWLYYLGAFGSLLTAFYMFRLYALTFRGNFRGTNEQQHHLHESPSTMTLPLIILAILSVLGGFWNVPEVLAENAHALSNFLSPVVPVATTTKVHESSQELLMMIVLSILVILTLIVAWNKYSKQVPKESVGFGKVLENKWYVDELYEAVIVQPLTKLADVCKNIEKSVIDGFVNGVGKFLQYSSRQIRLLQSGVVSNYILIMVLSLVVLFLIYWNQAVILSFFHHLF